MSPSSQLYITNQTYNNVLNVSCPCMRLINNE